SFREAAGEVEADHRPLAAEVAALPAAKGAIAARELGPSRHPVARPEPGHATPGFENASAEFVPEKLNRRLPLQTTLDAVEREGRNAQSELRLRDARLYAERFHHDLAGATDRFRNVVQPHVVELVETPRFHRSVLRRTNFWSEWQSGETSPPLPPADI